MKPNKRQKVVLNHDTKVEDKKENRKNDVQSDERTKAKERKMQQKLTSTPD